MKPEMDYTLYLVTDRDLMSTPTLEEAVENAVLGGCTVVQLREKHAASLEFYNTALKIKRITDRHHVPLIINDRVDIALAVNADGVHVGQTDIPAGKVRQLIGPSKILGVSVSHPHEVLEAAGAGADYLGVGAMFATDTKTDAQLTTLEELHQIRQMTSLPLVVIGGIGPATLHHFKGAGINGLAVVSAIIAQQDIQQAASSMKQMFAALEDTP